MYYIDIEGGDGKIRYTSDADIAAGIPPKVLNEEVRTQDNDARRAPLLGAAGSDTR
jgi:hypothetical protein